MQLGQLMFFSTVEHKVKQTIMSKRIHKSLENETDINRSQRAINTNKKSQ